MAYFCLSYYVTSATRRIRESTKQCHCEMKSKQSREALLLSVKQYWESVYGAT